MKAFLRASNGPWNQLVSNGNIIVESLENNKINSAYTEYRGNSLYAVPHRDEYSETVGYRINRAEQIGCFSFLISINGRSGKPILLMQYQKSIMPFWMPLFTMPRKLITVTFPKSRIRS